MVASAKMEGSLLFAVLFAAVLLFSGRTLIDALIDAINRFRGGGPPTPMHPIPADDYPLLRRRPRSKFEM